MFIQNKQKIINIFYITQQNSICHGKSFIIENLK